MNNCLAAALEYARRGWHVLPVRGKIPCTAHGVHDATTSEAIIRDWWRTWPSAGVAIAVGPSGLVVVDCDVKNGVDGVKNWLAYCKSNGIESALSTLSATTPSGGKHFVFKAPGEELARKIGFLPGVDILAGPGSYFVAPPSTRDGADYSWLN
jgi:Bifunctional DNA primase/polymerase, N-terminal